MKNLDNKAIDIELEKIAIGNNDAIDLMRLTYLSMTGESLLYNFSTLGSSRDKDDELYRWRYAVNSATLQEAYMYQKKAAKIQEIMSKIEELKSTDKVAYESKKGELESLKTQRDEAKAEFYKGIAHYDEIKHQNKQIEGYGISLSDINLSLEDIMMLVKSLVSPGKEAFWSKYFDFAKKFEIKREQAVPTNVGGTMGE